MKTGMIRLLSSPFYWINVLEKRTNGSQVVYSDNLKDKYPEGSKEHDLWQQERWAWLLLSLIMLFVAFGWHLLSLFWDWHALIDENKTYWFQRSGAVLVFAAILGQWRAIAVVDEHAYHTTAAFTFTVTTRTFAKRVEVLALVLTLYGTLVWAYGDLCF